MGQRALLSNRHQGDKQGQNRSVSKGTMTDDYTTKSCPLDNAGTYQCYTSYATNMQCTINSWQAHADLCCYNDWQSCVYACNENFNSATKQSMVHYHAYGEKECHCCSQETTISTYNGYYDSALYAISASFSATEWNAWYCAAGETIINNNLNTISPRSRMSATGCKANSDGDSSAVYCNEVVVQREDGVSTTLTREGRRRRYYQPGVSNCGTTEVSSSTGRRRRYADSSFTDHTECCSFHLVSEHYENW